MSKSKKSAAKSIPQPKKTSHVNFKALVILGGIVALAMVVGILYYSYSRTNIRDTVLAQAAANADNNEYDLALRHLDRFLAENEDDIQALEAKADILAKSAFTSNTERILEATRVHDQLIRLDPDGKGRLATRRKLIELYITYGERVRNYVDDLNEGHIQANESRSLAAIQAADELLKHKDKNGVENGTVDASAHRLKAMACMGQVPGLIVKKQEYSEALKTAKSELEKALEMDPSDIIAAEKLAELYMIHLTDPVNAEKVLDQMLDAFKNKKFASEKEANDIALKVRIARFRAFHSSGNFRRAQEELEAALKIAPQNLDILTSAASLALQLNENKKCREHLDAIPPKIQQENLRVRFLRGALEFAERHPDEAIEQWRQGLFLVGGSDVDLTWRLATNLIQFNRLVEARPLVDQYLRLVKPNNPMGQYLEGMYQEKTGHIRKAIELMSKARHTVPPNFRADVLMSLGHCYELIGDESNAMFVYNQAANLGGATTAPRRAMARLYQSTNPDRAIEELEIALSLSRANDRNKAAEIAKNRQDSGKAKPDLNAEGTPDPNILYDLIRIKMDRQMKLAKADRDFRDVAKLLAEAKKIAPENPALQGLMAQYLSIDNRLDEAVKTLEDTVKGGNRKRVESWLAWAEALEVLRRIPEAISVIDKGSTPDAAGDHAAFRSAKARLLLQLNQGSRAREVLTTNLESIAQPERPELTRALGDLLQELGDRSGAREAYIEWAKLAPESPFPALKLLSIAQIDGDDEAAKAGLDLLARLGRGDEPYALAAKALQQLRTDPTNPGPVPASRLDEARNLLQELNRIAPDFPVKFMIQGMIFECEADPKNPSLWKGKLEKAGESYRKSFKVGTNSPALPKLIEIYMKLNDDDKLNLLKVEYDDGRKRNRTEIAVEFDRLAILVALKLGDRKRAEEIFKRMSEGNPENRELRFAEARMFEANGKMKEAETALQDLVRVRPQEPITWFELIRFEATRRTPADVARTIDQARKKYTGNNPELFLAQCYRFGNDMPNALREFQRAADLKPDDMETLKALVDFRESTKQSEPVEPVLRKILNLDPKSTWASRTLALHLSSRFDPVSWSEAWSLIAPGAPSAGEAAEDRLIRATVLARSPDPARQTEAISAFASLANDLPISNSVGVDARLRLSQAMLDQNKPSDAWQYISPLTDDLTRANVIAIAIGIESLARLGKGSEAEKRLNRLSNLMPNSTQVALSKAWVLNALGKKEEAAASVMGAFEKVEKAPEAEPIANTCLDLLMKLNNLDSALVLAKKMAAIWPREAGNLARVQVARKEYDEALVSCRTALDKGSPLDAVKYATAAGIGRQKDKKFLKQVEEIGDEARSKVPNEFSVLILIATIRHLEEEYEPEVAFYRMALEKNPPNRQFLNNMAWTLSEGLHKPEEGFSRIEDLINREGPAAQYLDTRGVIQTRLKRYDKAIEDLEKSVQGDPSGLTYYHLSRAYFKAGNLAESRRCRDIANSKGFDLGTLDPTDKWDVDEVMGKP